MAKAATKPSAKKPLTKSAFVAHLAEQTELTKKDIEKILDSIVETIKHELGPKGAGKMIFPGMARLMVRKVKAVKGGVEKLNPLTKTPYITKNKPAYNKLRILPVKALKEALK